MAAFLVTLSTLPYPGVPAGKLTCPAAPWLPDLWLLSRAAPLTVPVCCPQLRAGIPAVSLGILCSAWACVSLPGPAALSLCTSATSQVGGDTLGSVPLGWAGSGRVPTALSVTDCPHVLSRTGPATGGSCPGDVGDGRGGPAGSCTGEGHLARGWLVSGLWVKHSTASPCPWLCQPQRKGADISAFVHFMSIYGHLGSLLTPSSQARHKARLVPPRALDSPIPAVPSVLSRESQVRGGRRFLHQEVFEKQGRCWFW